MLKDKKTEKDQQIIDREQVGLGIVRVRLKNQIDPNRAVNDLYDLFDELLDENVDHIIFDMGNVDFPNGSFISMLIAKTMEARRRGGDVKIVNLTETARNNFTFFTPLTYLSIGVDEVLSMDGSYFPTSNIDEFINGKPCSLRVDATVESINKITQFVTALAEKVGMEQLEISKLKIAIYEASINVVEHGYNYEPGNSMGIEAHRMDDLLKITISDHGKPFDFYDVKPYDVKEAFNEKREGGFGLYIIKRSVDVIKYESDPLKGNKLILEKQIK